MALEGISAERTTLEYQPIAEARTSYLEQVKFSFQSFILSFAPTVRPFNATHYRKIKNQVSWKQDLARSAIASLYLSFIYEGIGYPKYGIGGGLFKAIVCSSNSESSLCPAPLIGETLVSMALATTVFTVSAFALSRIMRLRSY